MLLGFHMRPHKAIFVTHAEGGGKGPMQKGSRIQQASMHIKKEARAFVPPFDALAPCNAQGAYFAWPKSGWSRDGAAPSSLRV